MNKDSKRISINLTAEIGRIKSYIRNNNGRGFDGTGYIFKKALKKIKKEGFKIYYNKEKCSYFIGKL